MTTREQFEKWVTELEPVGFINISRNTNGTSNGTYVYDDTRLAWLAWQEARKQGMREAANVAEMIGVGITKIEFPEGAWKYRSSVQAAILAAIDEKEAT